jgi:hypothetical protein
MRRGAIVLSCSANADFACSWSDVVAAGLRAMIADPVR